jgi:predicted methyltransferase
MYQNILTRKESDLIRAMSRDDDYSQLDVASLTRLTPSELPVLIEGLTRRGVLKIGDSNRIRLTQTGRELRQQLQRGVAGASPSTSSVMVTDDASAARMRENLQSQRPDTDLENYIRDLR